MKRISGATFALALAVAALVAPPAARADVQFGYPHSYSVVWDLNAVGKAVTVANVPAGSPCSVISSGTYVGTGTIYTSVDGAFDDQVSQGTETAPGVSSLPLPSKATAIRVQTTAYTSGDPYVAIDCGGGALVNAAQALGASATTVATASCTISGTTCNVTATVPAGQHCVAAYDHAVTTDAIANLLPLEVAVATTTLTIYGSVSAGSGTLGFDAICK